MSEHIERIQELTLLDLRGEDISEEDREFLIAHNDEWLKELVILKRKTETQMTSSNTRRFKNYHDYSLQKTTREAYEQKCYDEKVWRTNASRFIQEIEAKIFEAKSHTSWSAL